MQDFSNAFNDFKARLIAVDTAENRGLIIPSMNKNGNTDPWNIFALLTLVGHQFWRVPDGVERKYANNKRRVPGPRYHGDAMWGHFRLEASVTRKSDDPKPTSVDPKPTSKSKAQSAPEPPESKTKPQSAPELPKSKPEAEAQVKPEQPKRKFNKKDFEDKEAIASADSSDETEDEDEDEDEDENQDQDQGGQQDDGASPVRPFTRSRGLAPRRVLSKAPVVEITDDDPTVPTLPPETKATIDKMLVHKAIADAVKKALDDVLPPAINFALKSTIGTSGGIASASQVTQLGNSLQSLRKSVDSKLEHLEKHLTALGKTILEPESSKRSRDESESKQRKKKKKKLTPKSEQAPPQPQSLVPTYNDDEGGEDGGDGQQHAEGMDE
jgi:hypothetical protein